MATTPYFILSPNTLLSIIGLIRGPDKTVPTPAEDWRKAKVDVVIPALNEETNIAFCLDSITRQTMKPRRILIVDDGSRDNTVKHAEAYAKANGLDVQIIQRQAPIGKTPTLKRQARELDSDVEFIFDSDTILVSPNYIERTVEELYKGVGIASACGCVLSLRPRDRREALEGAGMKKFLDAVPDAPTISRKGFFHRVQMAITSLYRECLYTFLQKFVYRGQMVFFGSITHPVGCAVAYRRQYIEDLFNKYEPILGDDLTNSEDIFIGFALVNHGYRNIQLPDVLCRSQEPELGRLPHQFYMWSSAFLQSCFYFNSLVCTPFKAFKRARHDWESKHTQAGKEIEQKRKIKEQYREPFGEKFTEMYGRPIGWSIFMSAVEKIAFPVVILVMLCMRLWEPLVVTILAETLVSLTILTIVAPDGRRLEFLFKGIIVTPIRYSALLFDLTTFLRFALDVWISKDRRWRK
jgi:glycosyltransferase involved in cell wall biosynthesis